MKKGRVAIFLSGRGSNFEAIHQYSQKEDANFKIVLVISDQKDAKGIKTAESYNLRAHHIPPKNYRNRKEYEIEFIRILEQHQVELICLAGYMRIVGTELLRAFPNKILNIHPALLPSFPGLHAQKQALDHGVRVSGCTIHFVDSGVDTGPIIMQASVAVQPGDNEEKLSQRILKEEHKIYSKAIQLFFDNRLIIDGRKVKIVSP